MIRMISRNNPLWGAPRIHASFSHSESRLPSRPSPNTCYAGESLLHRFGEHSWTITLRAWCRWTFSPCRRSGFKCSTSSSYWHTTVGAFSSLASPLIPQRSGRYSNFAMPFRGTARHVICCATDRSFAREFVERASNKCYRHRAPWQRAYVERVIGSIRRECLDHVVVFNESSLRRILSAYCAYSLDWRTHLSLDKDARNDEE